jgi:hypothetical protein
MQSDSVCPAAVYALIKICLVCPADGYALMKYVLFAQLPATH